MLSALFSIGAKKAARLAADETMKRDLARLEADNATLRAQVEYWQRRAETLIDAALAKAGHTPVMATPTTAADAAPSSPFDGLRITAIGETPR